MSFETNGLRGQAFGSESNAVRLVADNRMGWCENLKGHSTHNWYFHFE